MCGKNYIRVPGIFEHVHCVLSPVRSRKLRHVSVDCYGMCVVGAAQFEPSDVSGCGDMLCQVHLNCSLSDIVFAAQFEPSEVSGSSLVTVRKGPAHQQQILVRERR